MLHLLYMANELLFDLVQQQQVLIMIVVIIVIAGVVIVSGHTIVRAWFRFSESENWGQFSGENANTMREKHFVYSLQNRH